jgi:glycosyltransferase involved in cell wall biosynthesis
VPCPLGLGVWRARTGLTMKIGYICSDFDVPVLGHEGCSIHVRELVGAFLRAGHEVFVLCAARGNGSAELDAPIHEIKPVGGDARVDELLTSEPVIEEHHLERDLRSVLFNLWLQSEGAKIIAREKPDFLYERIALFGFGGYELARRFGIPLIVEVNAPLCLEQDGYDRFTLTRTAGEIERSVLSNADALVPVSGWLGDFAVTRGARRERVHVIPNAVGDRFLAEPQRGRMKQELGLAGKHVVGYLGSFQSWHDVGGLVDAFAELAGADPDLALLLVGYGEEQDALKRRVAAAGLGNRVVFTGNVKHDAVPDLLAAMDVAVVPYRPSSNFYFSPMKLFESMAMATPTVAARIGQIADVVEHERTGMLYDPGNHPELVANLRRLLNDTKFAQDIGTAGRDQVLARHTWQAVAQQIVGIANDLRGR